MHGIARACSHSAQKHTHGFTSCAVQLTPGMRRAPAGCAFALGEYFWSGFRRIGSIPRATDDGNMLTTERLFWHCGAHTAEQKIVTMVTIPPIRITKTFLFSVARGAPPLLPASRPLRRWHSVRTAGVYMCGVRSFWAHTPIVQIRYRASALACTC